MTSLLHDPRLSHCRRLFLRNFSVPVPIGVHDFEKLAPQRVLVNVELYVPLSGTTPQRDRIDEVLDYDFIRHVVLQRVSAGHIELQETLCDDLLRLMMAHPLVHAARISTEKPDVYADCDSVGCEVFAIKAAR